MEIKKVIEYFVHHKDWDYILVIIRETRKINYSCWIVQIKEIKASSLFLNRSLSDCDRKIILLLLPGSRRLFLAIAIFFNFPPTCSLHIFRYITKKIGILSSVEYVLAHPQIFTTASKIWPTTKYPEPFRNGSLAKYIGVEGRDGGGKTGLIKITEYTRRGRTTNKRTAARVGERRGKNCHRAKPSTVR